MADGIFPSLVSKDRSVNAAANPIYVQITDGTNPLDTSAGGLEVSVNNTVTVSGSVTVSASDLDIRSLVQGSGNDNVTIWANTVKDGTGTDYIPLVDADGNLQVDVITMPGLTLDSEFVDDATFTVETDKVLAIGMLADETTPDSVGEGDIGIPRMTLDRKQLIVIADPSTDSQRLAVNSDGSINVNIVSAAVSGEIHDYDTSVNVGSDLTDNHDYTVQNTVFLLKSVIISASGNMKAEIQVGPLASLVTKAVAFLNGRQGDTQQIFFDPPIEVPVTSTGTVRVIRTNRQGAAMDVYSTIIGIDI